MNILDKIVADKQKEVEFYKNTFDVSIFEESPYFENTCYSLKNNIKEHSGVIAEFKRQSPSKGIINNRANIIDVVKGYEQANVSAISVLTNSKYFGGKPDDIINIRDIIDIPILRKEFIIDEYQIIEAKSLGADAILLIASVLTKAKIIHFSKLAKSLGLEILLEIHSEKELFKINQYIDCVGVNNRDLKHFKVDINNSISLSERIPNEFVKVSESGISSIDTIKKLKEYGFQAFLIGENFMKTDNPGNACNEFISKL